MNARNSRARRAAFTLVELLVAMGVFGIFAAGLLTMWNALNVSALNTTTLSRRQNDQMRVLDYLKRDLRRATTVELYNGATLVTGTTTFASELRLTVPGYYADSLQEDHAIGPKVTNTPTFAAGQVSYGSALTVRYYALNGAGIRNEAGTERTVADAAGAFVVSFKREASGAIRCRVLYNQPMWGGKGRVLRRQVDTICVPRAELQL